MVSTANVFKTKKPSDYNTLENFSFQNIEYDFMQNDKI